jgi:hypothetical protein
MKAIKPTTYQTVEEIEALIRLRESEAELLPSGTERQSVLIEIARLRAYADTKRWLRQPARERPAASMRSKS